MQANLDSHDYDVSRVVSSLAYSCVLTIASLSVIV
jgi:hypothetical protein